MRVTFTSTEPEHIADVYFWLRNDSEVVRRADVELSLGHTRVAPPCEPVGQLAGGRRLTALVKHHPDAASRQHRHLAALIGQFGHLGRPADAAEIAGNEFTFG